MSRFCIINEHIRTNAIDAIRAVPLGYILSIAEPKRSTKQNAKFHALCQDIATSKFPWAGKSRNADEWKVLIVSGHSVATKQGAEMVPGLENEFVNIRESTARMGVGRAASLIEYTIAFAVSNGIELVETRHGGFMEVGRNG